MSFIKKINPSKVGDRWPQAEQFLSCGQKLHKAGWWKRLGSAQISDKRPHNLEVKETSLPTHVQKGSLEVKKYGVSPHSKWGNQPQASSLESNLAKRYTCTQRRTLRYTNMGSEPGTSKWLAKENLEEMPHKSDSNYDEGATLSEPWVYPHVLYSFLS